MFVLLLALSCEPPPRPLCLDPPNSEAQSANPACPPKVAAVVITARAPGPPPPPVASSPSAQKAFDAAGSRKRAWRDYRACEADTRACIAAYPGLMSAARQALGR